MIGYPPLIALVYADVEGLRQLAGQLGIKVHPVRIEETRGNKRSVGADIDLHGLSGLHVLPVTPGVKTTLERDREARKIYELQEDPTTLLRDVIDALDRRHQLIHGLEELPAPRVALRHRVLFALHGVSGRRENAHDPVTEALSRLIDAKRDEYASINTDEYVLAEGNWELHANRTRSLRLARLRLMKSKRTSGSMQTPPGVRLNITLSGITLSPEGEARFRRRSFRRQRLG